MLVFNSNEPIKIAHLQKLTNKSMLNGTLVMEMINNSFSDSKKNFSSLIKRETFLIKKNKAMGSEKYISTRFR